MGNLDKVNAFISLFNEKTGCPKPVAKGKKLYTGVDLGTAYIVLAVVDEDGNPAGGAMRFAQVVKDGLVVDYLGAVNIVRELKTALEERLDHCLDLAGVAYPPGTAEGDRRAIIHVAEAAGVEVKTIIDEPTAANEVLNIKNGAVVDIGGGTTGIAILKEGRVVYVADEATGGTHFNLVISGAYKIPFEEAEELKQDPGKQGELFPVVKPVMQKVASIISRHIRGYDVNTIYLVGGTSCFSGIEHVVRDETGITTVKPENPFLVTPLGIALSVLRNEEGIR
ncbi:MAG: ethanolamine utilization protein EutJ [Firmicutes bacterium HGW-Firmicutes-14]|nr:MAG: ethanolamine utilization protein EutJ [Firmicutes bacterium HGW-Firmicutes-14]